MRSMRGKFDSSSRGTKPSSTDDDGPDNVKQEEKRMKRVSISMRESTRGDVTMESF